MSEDDPLRELAAARSHVRLHYAKPVRVRRPTPTGVSGFGIAALVLGIVAALSCWIPFFGLAVIPFAGIGLLVAIIGAVVSAVGRQSNVGMPVAGGILCMLAILIALGMSAGSAAVIKASVDKANQTRDSARVSHP
jgi:hypothetical protein